MKACSYGESKPKGEEFHAVLLVKDGVIENSDAATFGVGNGMDYMEMNKE